MDRAQPDVGQVWKQNTRTAAVATGGDDRRNEQPSTLPGPIRCETEAARDGPARIRVPGRGAAEEDGRDLSRGIDDWAVAVALHNRTLDGPIPMPSVDRAGRRRDRHRIEARRRSPGASRETDQRGRSGHGGPGREQGLTHGVGGHRIGPSPGRPCLAEKGEAGRNGSRDLQQGRVERRIVGKCHEGRGGRPEAVARDRDAAAGPDDVPVGQDVAEAVDAEAAAPFPGEREGWRRPGQWTQVGRRQQLVGADDQSAPRARIPEAITHDGRRQTAARLTRAS